MQKDRRLTRESLNRLLFLLASTGMTTLEFEQLVEEIQLQDLVELANQFQRARSTIRGSVDRSWSSPRRDIRAISVEGAKRDILSLLRDSHLTQREAAARIVMALGKQGGAKVRPIRDKEGFARWLDSVAVTVDPAVMLNAAVTAFETESPATERWRLPRR